MQEQRKLIYNDFHSLQMRLHLFHSSWKHIKRNNDPYCEGMCVVVGEVREREREREKERKKETVTEK
jgi:hypothetical protein